MVYSLCIYAFQVIQTPSSKWRPLFLNKLFIIYMSGKCLKILEKSGNFIGDKMYEPWN